MRLVDDRTKTVVMRGGTVRDLLEREGIRPGPGQQLSCSEDAWLTDLGIDWHRACGDWTFGAKVDGFYNFLKEKIISAPSAADPYVWLPYNIGRVEAWGADAVASARYDDGRSVTVEDVQEAIRCLQQIRDDKSWKS